METLVNGFKTNRAFAVTSLLVLLLLAIALAAPIISPFDPTHAEMKDAFLEPSMTHLFGTDKLGRDCFSRVLYGARASLTGGFFNRCFSVSSQRFLSWHYDGCFIRLFRREGGYNYHAL